MSASKESPREWGAHFWIGANFFAWLRLCQSAGFRFGWKQAYLAPVCSLSSLGNTLMGYLQNLRDGEGIRETILTEDPVFIIGHWRTGTTWLHELLMLDPQHHCPTSADCLHPTRSMSEAKLKRYFNWLMPEKRPMDNMKLGWDTPQEDEFALVLLGAPSPYQKLAFPNHSYPTHDLLDLEPLPIPEQKRWENIFLKFVKTLAYYDPRRLVLKSPPHTCRIPTLLKLFPKAKFLHIVRNPMAVIPSTVNLWTSLYKQQGLQTANLAPLQEEVFQTHRHVYQRLANTVGLIPKAQFHEVRYEDLVQNPITQLQEAYQHLNLGDFEKFKPILETHLAANTKFEKNRFNMSEELQREIQTRCAEMRERYGYS